MATLSAELQLYKDRIPEFIMKLYHILEQPQFQEYMCWHNSNEILIKSPKKVEEKVLPHFFRHKHLSSFIRQLNMYSFSKVNKLTKEKNHMYFKNDKFKHGQLEQMTKIKRNHKRRGKEDPLIEDEMGPDEDRELEKLSLSFKENNPENGYPLYSLKRQSSFDKNMSNCNIEEASIEIGVQDNQQLQPSVELDNYRNCIKEKSSNLLNLLQGLQHSNPHLSDYLVPIYPHLHSLLQTPAEYMPMVMNNTELAGRMTGVSMTGASMPQLEMMGISNTMRMLRMESLIFPPSQGSFYQLGN